MAGGPMVRAEDSGRQAHTETVGQALGGLVPGGGDADCRKVHRGQPRVAARVDAGKGLQIHGHVQRQAVVGAVAADLDAQCRDFSQPGEVRHGAGTARRAFLGALGQHGVAVGVMKAHIDARCAVHAVARDAVVGQGADDGFLEAVHIFFDVVARALQVQQRVGHYLAGAVVGDLAAPVGGDDGDVAWLQQVLRAASQPQGVSGCVFAQPQAVCRGGGTCGGELLHRLHAGVVARGAEKADVHAWRGALQHHFDQRVGRERAVQVVELCAAGGSDGDGQAHVLAAAAGAPFDARRIKQGVPALGDLDDGGLQGCAVQAHHLDGKQGGEVDQGVAPIGGGGCCQGGCRHAMLSIQ